MMQTQLRKIINEVLEEELSGMTILRPKDSKGLSDEAYETVSGWKRQGHVYRGMTSAEYDATVGQGKPIQSTGRYSHSSEGTNFSSDPLDAESYVNFGQDDPRRTGSPNYLVETAITKEMSVEPDGYIKSKAPVELQNISRIWKMFAVNGAILAKQIK